MKRTWLAYLVLGTTLFVMLVSLTCRKTPVGEPPATPAAPSGIRQGGINTPHEFSATTTDPDGDSIAIRFSWGDGATSAYRGFVASGDTVKMSHTWTSAGEFQVKAQAQDESGAVSGWSLPFPIIIDPIVFLGRNA